MGKLLERAPWNALKTLEMKSFTNTMYEHCNVRSISFSITLCSEKSEIFFNPFESQQTLEVRLEIFLISSSLIRPLLE